MFLLLWAYMDGEAADHMITKKQRTSLSLFLCHIHGIVDTCDDCVMYV